ncbi:patatin-like phospholipase family protein [Thaumasiovibrio subtropicus]|uniref:patatin-like phospholipase family protein n=1 Tax=Thaumasiovibrio subtropicus TaxID=1891207 RepID=UPI000B354B45|nr:patatin-like phospholipase family protein [Thaumasiovibrio subtropicus]
MYREKKHSRAMIIVLGALITFPGWARDSVGLVLSGGGAKGAAHIGVLEVLEENRIPVDVITGTSMGAYVAGMYAMGLSAEEVKRRTFSINWTQGYNDQVGREAISLRRKSQSDRYQLRTEIGIDLNGEHKIPSSAFQGHAMARILREMTQNLPALSSFDQLAIPYRSVATDIESVTPFVLKEGNLALAMQASMTVPGALKPVELENRVLVDGGIVNNMPVDQAQLLGAEHIVAVDLRDALYNREELQSGFNIAGQLITHMTNMGSDTQVALMSPSDVYIKPDVSHMTAVDFDQMTSAYAAGREATEAMLPRLLAWQLSEEDYTAYQKNKLDRRSQLFANSAFYIDKIEIVNNTSRSDQAIASLLDLQGGDVLSTDAIEAALDRLYAQEIFDRITYTIEQNEGENRLVVDVNEKHWGPGYLNFKLAIEDDYASRSEFSIGAQYLYTNLTDKGGEWLTEADLGSWKRFSTEVYLPLDYEQRYFTAAGLSWHNEFRRFGQVDPTQLAIDIPSSALIYDTEYSEWRSFAELGWNFSPSIQMTLGVEGNTGNYDVLNVAFSQDVSHWGGYATFLADTLDNRFFPKEGVYAAVKLGRSQIHSDIGDAKSKHYAFYYDTEWIKPFTAGRHSWVAGLTFGGSESDEPLPVHVKDLGGLFNLSGYSRYELNGRYRALGVVKYKYRLAEIDYGFVQSALYIGGSLERGNTWNQSSQISWDNAIAAGSVFLGADSLLGPVYLGYGQAENGVSSMYFYLGTHF